MSNIRKDKDPHRKLTEAELLYYLENDISDIEFLSDDELELDEVCRDQTNDNVLDGISTEDRENEDEDLADEQEGPEEIVIGENDKDDRGQFEKEKENFAKIHNLTEKSKIRWIQKDNIEYETRNIHWHASQPSTLVVDLPAPVKFFTKYIPDKILQQMADMTNLYATQQNTARFPSTSLTEIKSFIGIHIIMGNLQFPRVSMYWHRSMGIPLVKDNMPLSRFYKLRQAIHIVDITSREENNQDRLWKEEDFAENNINNLVEINSPCIIEIDKPEPKEYWVILERKPFKCVCDLIIAIEIAFGLHYIFNLAYPNEVSNLLEKIQIFS
ncbi:uncharacterized protein LOC116158962 [Photinus pyralis]|uniref:uncharacterized protein LOC116158962 n=1 Tax=Photinus pyralis TaxID=7054 RepID=UPI001266F8A3|nr:uncharacterized protein LOC116158962 [Photinus pyralis]